MIEYKAKRQKAVVIGIVNRDSKQILANHVNDAKANTLQNQIYDNLAKDSILVTDDGKGYASISHFSYNHRVVNRSKGKYVDNDARIGFNIHTNTIEGFWSQLKRGINSIYYCISKKCLQSYLN